MNINHQIKELGPGGLPRYNRKCNELIEAVNWLLGMQTANGKQITENPRGPVLHVGDGAPTATPASPWATDPDGNQAGWSLITCLNLDTFQSFQVWIWTGQTAKNVRTIPWMFDLSGIKASWLSGVQGEVWGTGSYPAGTGGNYRQAKFTSNVGSDNRYVSPVIWTGYALNPPITPPTSAPALYLINPTVYSGIDSPYLRVVVDANSGDLYNYGFPTFTVTFSFIIQYDGAAVFSYTGSHAFNNNVGYATEIALDKTGWVFDPQGLPGYTYGNQKWIYKYMGPISANPNPPIVQTLTWSMTPSVPFYVGLYTYIFGTILITG